MPLNRHGHTMDLRSAGGMMSQFLAWVSAQPRTYAETLEVWRTSCPRLSVWEDALADGLVQVLVSSEGTYSEAKVLLTPRGAAFLDGEQVLLAGAAG